MPLPGPRQYISMDPRFRAPGERFRAQLQIAWSPDDELYTVSVTVWQGEDESDLRSCVVAPPVGWLDARPLAHCALTDLLDLVRRSGDPFDDLT